jgi:hypothetical protein
MLFERLSMTLDNIPQNADEGDFETTKIRPDTATAICSQAHTCNQSIVQVDNGANVCVPRDVNSLVVTREQPISRDFGLNHNSSVRRKPVPQTITTPSTTDLMTRDPVLAALEEAEAAQLHHAGNAAQTKRKKRKVSVAFSEIFANLSDKKGGTDGGEGEEGVETDDKPRRIKRMKTRISSWFVQGKKEH